MYYTQAGFCGLNLTLTHINRISKNKQWNTSVKAPHHPKTPTTRISGAGYFLKDITIILMIQYLCTFDTIFFFFYIHVTFLKNPEPSDPDRLKKLITCKLSRITFRVIKYNCIYSAVFNVIISKGCFIYTPDTQEIGVSVSTFYCDSLKA